MPVIPPACFGKALLCWLSSFLCQPSFALSCPRPGGFLPALRALWSLPRYARRYRKPGTSFLRPSQDVCYCLEIFKTSTLFSHKSDTVTGRRKVHLPESLPEGAQTFISQTRESTQPAPKSLYAKQRGFTLRLSQSF